MVVLVFSAWALLPILTPGDSSGSRPVFPQATNNFDQFVVVLMENHDLSDIYGPAPYMTQLADQYAFSQHWQSITNPSQPNYIAILGGSTFGVSGDGNHPNLNHPTIVDIVENSGHTWKAFAESAGGSGCGLNPPRGEDHYPFLSYTTITGNSARCANLVSGGPTEVTAALNAGTNFIWLTPTDNHNMHDNSVSSGDSWLQSWVPGLLSAMAGKKAALFIMYDEGYASPPLIYAGFSGPATKTAYKSSVSYNHYSLLKLLEDVWGGGNVGQGDVGAASPVEFFTAGGPDFGISASPSSVSFATGLSGTSSLTLQSGGGFSGAVSLTTASAPAGVTTSCTPASISGTQTSTCTFGGLTAGSYSVTVTGTSGTLVHAATIAVTVTTAGPTARFSYSPTVPKVNDTVLFDASSSSDTNSAATLQARWDWEGDGTWDTSFSSTLTAQHAFPTPGTYLVKLEIQDSSGFSAMQSQGVLVLDLQGTGGGAPPGYGLTDPSTLQARGPIAITSNGGFSAANGVRSGTGTSMDPYIISDWFIDGNSYSTAQAMLWIESTDAYVVIENVRIANLVGTNQWEGIQLGHWPATVSTQHVTIRHNAIENAQHAYGIAVRSGSSDIHVEANYVSMDASFEWVFGIATDRAVHDVTVTGNYVNAYTSGTFHTGGIHLGDTYVDDASRATGVIATRNTVVNATAGGIVTASAVDTVITGNLVSMDYPGRKTVSADAPHGIDITEKSDGATVVGNVIHTLQWGILARSTTRRPGVRPWAGSASRPRSRGPSSTSGPGSDRRT
ncbi:MAG: PKD domain-containing protein [Methanobacteriota archaeon]|nr:MAG: PKD domain-containing protein [Euryarchaeota archaeon]